MTKTKEDFEALPTEEVKRKGMPLSIADVLHDYIESLGDGTKSLIGLATGFDEFNKTTLGLQGVIVLDGIPGQGKTSLTLQMAYDVCLKEEIPVIFYSLEMPRYRILNRMFSRVLEEKHSDIQTNGKSIFNSLINTHKYDEMLSIADRFNIRVSADETEINFKNVKKEINLIKKKHNKEQILIVIDHLQAFPFEGAKNQLDKENELITNFKRISEETKATIILIAQKNKAGYKNKDGLEATKGSSSITYLADMVISLFENKPEGVHQYSKFQQEKARKIELIIKKNRYSSPAIIKFEFEGDYARFIDSTEKKRIEEQRILNEE